MQRVLIGILAGSLVIRIVALLQLKESVYFDYLLWDERRLHDWAAAIASGTYQSTSVYENSPLPAYFVALIYKLLSANHLWIRIMNLTLGTATCFVGYLAGKAAFDRKTGLITCLFAALYAPMILFSVVPLKTTLSIFLFALVLFLLLKNINRPSAVHSLILGLMIGLACNVRANYLLLVPVLLSVVVVAAYRGQGAVTKMRRMIQLKRAALLTSLTLVAFAAAVAPVIIRNYVVAHEAKLTTSQAGFNLYIGNNVHHDAPYYRPVPFATTSATRQGVHFTIEASRRSGGQLSPQEASDYWTRETLRQAAENPGAAIGKLLKKIVAVVHRYESGDHYDIGFLSEYVSLFKLPFLGLGVIFPLAVIGMVLLGRRSRTRFWLVVVGLVYAATLVVFYTNARYRLPLALLCMPLAAKGFWCVVDAFKQRNTRALIIAIIAGVITVVFQSLPIPGAWDRTAYLNTHAIVLISRGDHRGAEVFWGKAAGLNGACSPFAVRSLARM